MQPEWRLLPKSKATRPLLFRSSFEQSSYWLQVTDLSSIWSEDVSRDDIVRRAREVESDIHPEDDSSQMQILLDKLRSALEGEPGTSIFVRPLSSKLELFLGIPLPGGLSELQWSMSLGKQPLSVLQSAVINPVVANVYLQQQQIEQLSNCLREKDEAIGKILDKVESLGLDFGTIFPNARLNRKGNLRQQVLAQVKGLQVYDEKASTSQSLQIDHDGLSAKEVLVVALNGIGSDVKSSVAQCLPVEGNGTPPMPVRSHDPVVPSRRRVTDGHTTSQSQADGFQRQRTPEAAKRVEQTTPTPNRNRLNYKQTVLQDDDSTEDEDDLDAGMAKPTPKRTQPLLTPAHTRMEVSSTVSPSERRTVVRGTPEGEARPHPLVVPAENEQPAQQTSDAPQRRGKLGKIGGRKAATTQPDSPAHAEPPLPQPADEVSMPDAPVANADTPTKRKLGRIGGSRATKPTSVVPDDARTGTAADPATASQGSETVAQSIEKPSAPESTPKPVTPKEPVQEEEDPKAKADKKREALKRKLDDSKTSGKTKRRF